MSRRWSVALTGGSTALAAFLLTLEHLESTFYAEAMKRAGVKGELKQLIALIGKDEQQQVGALAGTVRKLGGKPVKEPKFKFEYSDTAGFLELGRRRG